MSASLELISTSTMTDDVQTVNITNVFSDKYDVYMIKGSNMLGKNSTATGLNLRFINASNSVITSGYTYAQVGLKGNTSFSEGRGTSEDRIWNVFGGLDDNGQSAGNIAYIFNPFSSSSYTFTISQSSALPSGNFRMYKGIGLYPQTTSLTGFQVELNESASRFSGEGKVSVYGVK